MAVIDERSARRGRIAALARTGGVVPAFCAMLAFALVPLAFVAADARAGDWFTGAAGPYPPDQLQYLAWIRESANHGLVSNVFNTASSPHAFLHPMFFLSGLLLLAGVGLGLAFLVWLPIGTAVLLGGYSAYVRRLIPGPGSRRLAVLFVALFYGAPLTALAHWAHVGNGYWAQVLGGELAPAVRLWGYFPAAISVGLLPLALLGAERIVDPARRAPGRGPAWYLIWTSLAGALAAWCHPWEGETLLALLVLLFLWARGARRLWPLAVPAAATVLPLIYYWALTRIDPASWGLDRWRAGTPTIGWMVAAVAPLAVFAIVGLRRPGADFQERVLVLWPLVALAFYVKLAITQPAHALEGVSLPMSILAARGIAKLRVPRLAIGALVLLGTAPGLAALTATLHDDLGKRDVYAVLLNRDDRSALLYLAHAPRAGGVMSSYYLGSVAPAITGRPTWVGHLAWTPNSLARLRTVDALFKGELTGGSARQAIRQSDTRFIAQRCREGVDLKPALGSMLRAERRFGCDVVYELR